MQFLALTFLVNGVTQFDEPGVLMTFEENAEELASDVRSLYRRLGRVIGVSPRTIHRRVVEGVAETPYSNVTVKTDVAKAAFNYLRERKEQFPGISVEKQYLRSYPHDKLAAQRPDRAAEYRKIAQEARAGAEVAREIARRYGV